MKIIGYVGIEEPVMVIEKATDLYPALDHIQTRMIELSEVGSPSADKCADFISKLMDMTEDAEFGSFDDVDNIEYS